MSLQINLSNVDPDGKINDTPIFYMVGRQVNNIL